MASLSIAVLPGYPELPETVEGQVHGVDPGQKFKLKANNATLGIYTADANGDIFESYPAAGFEAELLNMIFCSYDGPLLDGYKLEMYDIGVTLSLEPF